MLPSLAIFLTLSEDTIIGGYEATNKLVIDKAITLDLGGKTLTTECGWGGIDLKGGASIKNGTINHTGNTAAIKAYQVGSIENVTINVTETAGKVKGGIVVQEGAGCYIGSIKDVTITGATNGIETYLCGDRDEAHPYAIGSMENVTIKATKTGILLSAPVGTVKDSSITGTTYGIEAHLKGTYSVAIDLVNCTVNGETGIYAYDEEYENSGTMKITYDSDTAINGNIIENIYDNDKDQVSITKK